MQKKKAPGKSQPASFPNTGHSSQQATGNCYVLIAGMICAVLAFMLYINTLGHDYTVDDGTVISNNKITTKGISAIPEIFSSSYRAGFWERNEGLYRPLSVAMFAVEWEIAPENPAPGHVINILLYALTAYLLLITLARIFKGYSLLLPFCITLLFVVHPIHTEVVANIKSRDEILCLLFTLLTFSGLLKYLDTGKVIHLVWSPACYFLAFLSKESAITMLAFIPVLIWFTGEQNLKKIILTSLPFLGAAALYMLIRVQVLGEFKGSPEIQLINNSMVGATSFAGQLATAILVMGKYFYLLLIPHPLSFDYSYNQIPVVSFADLRVLITTVMLITMVYFAIRDFKKRGPVALGIIYFFITVSLVSNFIIMIESTMAERFMYLPGIGIFIVLVYLSLKAAGLLNYNSTSGLTGYLKAKPVFTFGFLIILLAYSVKTVSRNADWKNNLTLLSKDVVTCPESARIRYAYGSALLIEQALKEDNPERKRGYLNKCIQQLEKGVSILPNYAEAWNHLGIAYKEIENYPAAVGAFEKARAYKEFSDADFYISSGLAYGNMKQYDMAIADFNRAIEIDPKNAEAYNNKGLYLYEKGQPDSALVFFDKAISLKPEFYQAFYNKGNTVASKGNYKEAISLYEESLKYKPEYTDALLNMGNSYAAMADYNKALKYFTRVEAAEPTNKKVLINIGITYRILGDEAKANSYFEKAEKLK